MRKPWIMQEQQFSTWFYIFKNMLLLQKSCPSIPYRPIPGFINLVPEVAYHFCLNLPVAFSLFFYAYRLIHSHVSRCKEDKENSTSTHSMVYKGHLYKGHMENFWDIRGHIILTVEKLRDTIAHICKKVYLIYGEGSREYLPNMLFGIIVMCN